MDIEPKHERSMVMRSWGRPQISVIAAYAPTAQSEEEHKDRFWTTIKQIIKEEHARGLAILFGDLNARIQAMRAAEEHHIGQHEFDQRKTTLHLQSEGYWTTGRGC